MNELKNYHGLAKAQYRGLDNVQIQAYMAAIAINIKRIIFWCLVILSILKINCLIFTTFYNRPEGLMIVQ